jgi:hypothetical protein
MMAKAPAAPADFVSYDANKGSGFNIGDYTDWNAAYRFLNDRLFGGELPEVVFTLHRCPGSRGYASMDRFADRDGSRLHELAMNPDLFLERTDRDTLSTLAHEMCHVWQYCYGKPGRGRYHNRQWADRMEAIGLMPSNTGRPGGKRTGQQMTHYIVDGGLFDLAADELLAAGWMVKRGSGRADKTGGGIDKSKVKFTCASCGQNAWAKASAKLVCGECDMQMHNGILSAFPGVLERAA